MKSFNFPLLAAVVLLADCGLAGVAILFSNQLNFLTHVMENQTRWKNVLKERVKGLPDVPHGWHMMDALPQENGEAVAEDIVHAIILHHRQVGSFVNHGVVALRMAFSCYTLKNMMYQIYLINELIVRDLDPSKVVIHLANLKPVMVKLWDKAAFTGETSEIFKSVYWEVYRLENEKVPINSNYPKANGNVLTELYDAMLAQVRQHCYRVRPIEFFSQVGVRPNVAVVDDVEKTTVKDGEIAKMVAEHCAYIDEFYTNLKIDTMNLLLWNDILHFQRV
ncbi:uncharacterized protein LOC126842842 [Adelges cooleyi]|uniref:uncharacterized protein LOC126842842 n=1 Tax=Adelges cooleyi TaxID=133065 RepID=UPI00217F5F56|nr:uncharacterized protein LOC126842842 [Adelges cooleyi]